jgi:hypothetical protein
MVDRIGHVGGASPSVQTIVRTSAINPTSRQARPRIEGLIMFHVVTYFALALSVLNWLVFAVVVFWKQKPAAPRSGLERSEQYDARDPAAARNSAVGLAGALGKAGPMATSAAMCLACLLIAVIAAGIGY